MATKKPAPKALPKTLGAACDILYDRQQARLALQRKQEDELKTLKDQEAEAEEHVLNLLTAQGLESARGERATVTIQEKDVPTVTDWDKLGKWVARTGDIAVFQKRLSTTHFGELRDAKVAVPGVQFLPIKKLSITKAAR